MHEIQSNTQWSEENNTPKQWQWNMHAIFFPISILFTVIGQFLMNVGNVLMFDTHHLEISIKPKNHD